MIRQRQKRNTFVLNPHAGHSSPLSSAEPDFIATLLHMAKMRQSLTPSQSVHLINSLLVGTQAQRDLVAFKKKNSHGKSGEIGLRYWRAFKKRNTHLICSKRGQKYALDCVNWTNFANFK